MFQPLNMINKIYEKSIFLHFPVTLSSCLVRSFIISYIWRTSFSQFVRIGLLATNSISFLLSDNVFISPSLLTGYSIHGWQFFSFSTWKIWEVFSHSFLKYSFSPNLFLISFWDFDDGSVAIVPQVPGALLIFSVYFISVVQGKSYWSVLRFIAFSPLLFPLYYWAHLASVFF